MRALMFAAVAAIALGAGVVPAIACSDADAAQAQARLEQYLDRHPNKRAEANRIWRQIVSGYGGKIPESQRCNAIAQLMSRLDSER